MYLLSVSAVILCFIVIQFVNPISIFGFVDVISMALLVILVVPIMLSAGLLKDLNNAIRLVLGKRKEAAMLELKRAKLAVDMMIKISIYSSIFVTLMELVVLLHNMSDPSYLGPMISMSLLIMLYAMVVSLLFMPIRGKLEQRILEYIPSCPEKDEEQQGVPERKEVKWRGTEGEESGQKEAQQKEVQQKESIS